MAQQNAQTVFLEAVKMLISNNELRPALERLQEFDRNTQAGLENDLIMQMAKLNQSEQDLRDGISTKDERDRDQAKIRRALLELVAGMPARIALNHQLRGLTAYQFDVPTEAGLEKIIGPGNSLLRINWLEKALRAAKAVCRIVRADGELGTGFLTRDGFLFTNNHVLPSAEHARTAFAEFNYELDVNGAAKSRVRYRLDSSNFVTSPFTAFDFTKVKVIDQLGSAPLSQWGFLEIDPAAVPAIGEPVTIIQHPKGHDKQIALDANEVISVWEHRLFYTTDTEPGSSGSPVFNRDWKVVAIHHAGKRDDEGGLPINAHGDRRGANRGILFSHILAFLGGNRRQPTDSVPVTGTEIQPEIPQQPAVNTPQPAISPTTAVPLPSAAVAPPKIVILYAEADQPHCDALSRHLSVMKQTGKISLFRVHKDTSFGEDAAQRTAQEIPSASFILCLLTAYFFDENEPWFGMANAALAEKRTVIPIRIRNADLEGTGFERLRGLPTGQRAVSDFSDVDAAYSDIADGIRQLLKVK